MPRTGGAYEICLGSGWVPAPYRAPRARRSHGHPQPVLEVKQRLDTLHTAIARLGGIEKALVDKGEDGDRSNGVALDTPAGLNQGGMAVGAPALLRSRHARAIAVYEKRTLIGPRPPAALPPPEGGSPCRDTISSARRATTASNSWKRSPTTTPIGVPRALPVGATRRGGSSRLSSPRRRERADAPVARLSGVGHGSRLLERIED